MTLASFPAFNLIWPLISRPRTWMFPRDWPREQGYKWWILSVVSYLWIGSILTMPMCGSVLSWINLSWTNSSQIFMPLLYWYQKYEDFWKIAKNIEKGEGKALHNLKFLLIFTILYVSTFWAVSAGQGTISTPAGGQGGNENKSNKAEKAFTLILRNHLNYKNYTSAFSLQWIYLLWSQGDESWQAPAHLGEQ